MFPSHGCVCTADGVDSDATYDDVFFSDPEVIDICQCEPANKSVDSSCCQQESVKKFVDGEAEDAHDVVHAAV